MLISNHVKQRLKERFNTSIEEIKSEKFERVQGQEAEKLGLNSVHGATFLIFRNRGLAIAVKDNTLLTALFITE